ncbi:MAG: HD domain-containing protein [Alphaproteobacteria bacterium]|nr:HD domain-containing protein [Alphaproteobacteria bacterium]
MIILHMVHTPIHVLVIEDNPGDARLIELMLSEQAEDIYRPSFAVRLAEGLEILSRQPFEIVLLDLSLPDSHGMSTVEAVLEAAPATPIIVLTGLADETTAMAAMKAGAQDYLAKGQGDGETLRRSIRYAIERMRTEEDRRESGERLRRALMQTIQAVGLTIEKRDPYTAGHQQRVSELAVAIGRELDFEPERLEGLMLGSVIHDIGKIAIPSSFLNKPGKLTATEFALIKTHSAIGFDIIKDVEFTWPIAQMVRQHHERMDGSGYPDGLQGGDILLESRIICVADVIESMASNRPYRAALGIDVALAEVAKNKGRLYDSDVTEACMRLFKEGRFSFGL